MRHAIIQTITAIYRVILPLETPELESVIGTTGVAAASTITNGQYGYMYM